VLSAKGPILNPQGKTIEAFECLNKYNYRKEFGLSYRDFVEEPLEEFFINNEVMSAIADLQARERKRLERNSRK
jgi:hypothetical protein